MKKELLIYFCLGGASLSIAQTTELVIIPLTIVDENSSDGGTTKDGHVPLLITQDNYIITFPAELVDYTLELRNNESLVVYSTFLPSGTTQVVLPTTLLGNYELRLITDTYYYIGYINL